MKMLTNNLQGRKLKNILSEFDLHDQIVKPTRLHRNKDAIFSNVQAHKSTFIDTPLSDHRFQLCEFKT